MEAAALTTIRAEIATCPERHRSGISPTIPTGPTSERVVGVRFSASAGDEEIRMSNKVTITRPKSLRAKVQQVEVDLGFRWGLPNSILLVVGVASLVLGYLSMSKGSITLSPLLLVIGYCVLIPAALLVRGGGSDPGE
jgi:hypothetical protein